MRADVRDDNGAWTLRVAGAVDIRHAAALHAAACEAARAPGTLTLDLGEVERVDVAGLQILLALLRAVRPRGRMSPVAPAVTETCRRLGLEGALE